jgi:hypothetical protein
VKVYFERGAPRDRGDLPEFWRRQARRDAFKLAELPYIPQADDASCGLACVLMLARYYGVPVLGRLRRYRVPDSGLSFPALIQLVRDVGLVPVFPPRRRSARRLRHALDLIDAGIPVTMAFGDAGTETTSHYALLVGYSETELFFHDPFLRPFFPRNRRAFIAKWKRENRWFLGVKGPPLVQASRPGRSLRTLQRMGRMNLNGGRSRRPRSLTITKEEHP